jgi:PPIC-type PPIASE domain
MAGSKNGAWSWRRLALGTACLAGLAAASYTGSLFLPHAGAQPTAAPKPGPAAVQSQPAAPAQPASASDYGKRPVAFLHDNEAVTREQLGEYLIARYGAEKLPLLINKIIIEEACRAKGVEVTAAEVEASLAEDLGHMGVDQKTFVNNVLKQYKKTLYEWKEDVIRPKLLMTKMVRSHVTVSEEEIRLGFDAYYGEKIDCRLIYWPTNEQNVAQKEYATIRDNAAEFDRQAKQQANSNLAASGGHVTPLGHRTTGNDEVEREAFKLQPDELSPLIATPEGIVVIKCVKRIPAQTDVSLESQRTRLYKEVFEKKVQQEIPKEFLELAKQAKVKQLLADPTKPENLMETTQQLLNDGPPEPPALR